MALHPALLQLIQALADDDARRFYLAAEPQPDAAAVGERANPALPATDQAA